MLLLDSTYINYGGGLNLLKYLIRTLHSRYKDNVFYLLDIRCASEFDFIPIEDKYIIRPSIQNRYNFYRKNKNRFSSILCFANIPPPIKVNAIVFTYFHNINLLRIPKHLSFKTKLYSILKRQLIFHLKKNSDYWIVQTDNTANEIIKELHIKKEKVNIFPFYELPNIKNIVQENQRNDYIFIGDYSESKGHFNLIKAWCELHKKGIDIPLHLTVSELPNHKYCLELIEKTKSQGVNIINHGFIPQNEVISLYQKSKALIYPSVNESLGLGIIEAFEYGCDLIISDLPFAHSICKASVLFDPYDVNSITNAVIKYESRNSKRSSIKIHNMINELIEFITNEK